MTELQEPCSCPIQDEHKGCFTLLRSPHTLCNLRCVRTGRSFIPMQHVVQVAPAV
uniref:Uncharacterized protein n=1 Tax=Anguilla anguilla TaxID=7936 RepID=A0A0E9PI02_ANGAN